MSLRDPPMAFYLKSPLSWVTKIIRLIFRVRSDSRRIILPISIPAKNHIKYKQKKYRKNHSSVYNVQNSISHWKISSIILTVSNAIHSNVVNVLFRLMRNQRNRKFIRDLLISFKRRFLLLKLNRKYRNRLLFKKYLKESILRKYSSEIFSHVKLIMK